MNATQPVTDEPVTTALRKALWNILHWDVESTIPVELWQAAHKAATRADLSQEERRITAALKACEGVPTEILENSVSVITISERLAEIWRLRRDRNELRAAVKPLVDMMTQMQGDGFFMERKWLEVLKPAQSVLAPDHQEVNNG